MLVVAHQDGSTLRQPGQGALDHPAARFVAGRAWARLLQLAHALDVRCVLIPPNYGFARPVVVILVQAKMLRILLGWLRPIDHDGFDGLFQQFVVVNVGAGNDDAKRATLLVHDHAAFDTVFPAICRVGADGAPPKRPCP